VVGAPVAAQTKSLNNSPEQKVKENSEDKTLVRDLPMYPSTKDPIDENSVLQAALPVLESQAVYQSPVDNAKNNFDYSKQLEDHMTRARASCAEWVGQDELQELYSLISDHQSSSGSSLDQSDLLNLFKEAHLLSPVIDPEALVTIYRLHNLECEAKML
jgi:polysaccharide deacetylase 2 family uncharacterized protein YibQ